MHKHRFLYIACMIISKHNAKYARYLANQWLGHPGDYYWLADRKKREFQRGQETLSWSERPAGPGHVEISLCAVPEDRASVASILERLGNPHVPKLTTLALREKKELCVTMKLAAEYSLPVTTELKAIVQAVGPQVIARYQQLLHKVPSYAFSEAQLQRAFPAEYALLQRG